MSPSHLTRRGNVVIGLILGVVFALVWAPAARAQQNQSENPPKAELFVGYQWLNPGGDVPQRNASGNVVHFKLPSIPQGVGSSLAWNFTKYWALEGDYGGNWNKYSNVTTATVGPKLTWREEGMNVFVHTLFGYSRLTPPNVDASNGLAAVLGGGMDLTVWKKMSIRLFEADYVWQHHNFSSIASPLDPSLRRPSYNGVRLRSGLVFNFGGAPPVPPVAACAIDRSEVMVGEPVHVTVAPSNFNPKHTVTYNWSSTGGKLEGKDTGAAIDTAGAAPGSYTVTARVTDPKVKKGGEASCTANFTVKPLNPPQISCSASPSTVEIGAPSTVTCSCTSPDNVPVTVAGWNSTGGSISGSGNSATLTTTGASAGTATISATCTDSRGLTASASTSVTVNNPPPPPPPPQEARLALHSVYFATSQPTAKNPQGGLVASQQQTLVTLATDFKEYLKYKPDAHLTLEGHADVRGTPAFNQALSERRVARVKSFLVENGVPEASIETQAFGEQHNMTEDEVKASVMESKDLTDEQRARALKNLTIIKWASNRRVDVRLHAGTQTEESVRRYPFSAADALTLIGVKPAAKKAAPTEKPAPKKK